MRDVVDIMALLVVQEKGKRGVKSAYEVDFEPVFLRKSEEFYKEEAESSLQAFDASTYLRLVSIAWSLNDIWRQITNYDNHIDTGREADTGRTRSVLCISCGGDGGSALAHPRTPPVGDSPRDYSQHARVRSGHDDR